jgi:hypothetical protein
MITLSPDTHPEIEERLITMLRGLGVAKKFNMVRSLTSTAIHFSRRAIRRANPSLDERELKLKFVSLHYGDDLANRLRKYMDARSL